jgi:hypothetical protein
MIEKPRKDSNNEMKDIRKCFFWAFNAFPASSPFMPKIQDKNRERFFFFNNKPLVFLIASSGVILLSVLAGIHAEKITVKNEMKTVAANMNG